jgi:hypothetical protein
MTQAMNLANFANSLDSSGGVPPSQLNAPVTIAKGGTNASTAANARTNLGATTVGNAVFIAANAGAAQTAIGTVIGTNVPSVTGTGASGTWGINITGNAATATSATSATSAATATSATSATTATALSTASGAAPSYGARAWGVVTIPSNGAGITLAANGNIASVTRSGGAGTFYVTFSTAMPDANYDVNISAGLALGNTSVPIVQLFANGVAANYTAPTASGFYFITMHSGNLSVQDCARICITVFR